MQKKCSQSVVYLIVAVVLIASSLLLPLPAGLSRPGLSAILLLLAAIILWVSNALPIAITTILMTTMMPFLGVMPFDQVLARFTNSTFFFMVATFCLTMAISSSPIPKRVSVYLMKVSGTSSVKLLFSFAFGAAAFSSIMSNVPSCAIFCALILSLIQESEDFRKNTALVKCLLIAVTYASVIGGFSTPAGTSGNILAINLFREITGSEITFLQWTIVGVPVVTIMLVICCLWLLVIFRPEAVSQETLDAVSKQLEAQEAMDDREKKIIVITGTMFALWILGTWIPVLNTTAVALIGMCLFFFPGINVLTWSEFSREAPWDMIFLISGSGALAYGLSATAADLWLVQTILPDAAKIPGGLILLACAMITAVLHILIPSGPGTIAIALPAFLQLTRAFGLNEFSVMMICTLWSCVVLVMPVDAVALVTYSTGQYRVKDLLKAGIPAYLFLIPVSVGLIQILCMLLF